jgi:hypothetical protein
MTGLVAALSSAAAAVTSATGRGASISSGPGAGAPTSPVNRSTGISTNTGPDGGVSATCHAPASTPGIASALLARPACLTSGANEASWSGSSCR